MNQVKLRANLDKEPADDTYNYKLIAIILLIVLLINAALMIWVFFGGNHTVSSQDSVSTPTPEQVQTPSFNAFESEEITATTSSIRTTPEPASAIHPQNTKEIQQTISNEIDTSEAEVITTTTSEPAEAIPQNKVTPQAVSDAENTVIAMAENPETTKEIQQTTSNEIDTSEAEVITTTTSEPTEAAPENKVIPQAVSDVENTAITMAASPETTNDETLEQPLVTSSVAHSTHIHDSRIARASLTWEVNNLEPGTDAEYTIDLATQNSPKRILFFTEAHDMAGQQLFYKWKKNDELVATVEINVGSERWRSYSSKTLMSGDWHVSASNAKGDVLATATFSVTETNGQ